MNRRQDGWNGRRYDGSARFDGGFIAHGLTQQYVELMEVQYMAIRARVRCPKCEAERGRDCRTAAGNAAMMPHVARKELWRETICAEYGAILHF